MKIKLLLILLLLIPKLIFGQTTQTEVLPSGGGRTENAQYKNFGTFGQPNASESASAEYTAKAGFINAGASVPPLVTTDSLSEIGIEYAIGGGEVTHEGFAPVTARGIVWSLSPNPELGINELGHTVDSLGIGEFVSEMTGLSESTFYYVRAYATNEAGTGYGEEILFSTIPTLGEWGLIAMIILMAGIGVRFISRKYI